LKGTRVTKLDDLFDVLDLEAAIAAGYVRTQTHPTLPYTVHNYSELAQFERVWNPVTRQCRGLITDGSGEVIARPFPKTHNYDEPDAPRFDLDHPVTVADKLDGSLGIGYPTGDGYAIATRGSFASEQALHATQIWQDRYASHTTVPAGITPLWEIVYPANRIVVDYQGLDDLVLLGGVEIATGDFIPADAMALDMLWTGPVAATFDLGTFGEVLATAPREGREGYIVRSRITGEAVKYKFAEYVKLHALVTGMNERVVWEHLGAGGTVDELAAPLPDEFHPWVRGVAARLVELREATVASAEIAHSQILAALPDGWMRKDYALAAQLYGALRPYLFNLLDGKDPRPGIWRTLRPSGAVTMTGGSNEDAA
jgi:RNA ligase